MGFHTGMCEMPCRPGESGSPRGLGARAAHLLWEEGRAQGADSQVGVVSTWTSRVALVRSRHPLRNTVSNCRLPFHIVSLYLEASHHLVVWLRFKEVDNAVFVILVNLKRFSTFSQGEGLIDCSP